MNDKRCIIDFYIQKSLAVSLMMVASDIASRGVIQSFFVPSIAGFSPACCEMRVAGAYAWPWLFHSMVVQLTIRMLHCMGTRDIKSI